MPPPDHGGGGRSVRLRRRAASTPSAVWCGGDVEEEAGYVEVGGERVFTVVHRPLDEPRGTVLIVSPLLAEHVANYRREVELARRLATAGIAVARFHARGTGRSEGAPEEMTFSSVVADADAVARAVTTDDHQPLVVVGTRVGAVVAAAARPASPLVAWAPVTDHARYVREVFRSLHLHALKEGVPPPADDLSARLVREGVVDVFGYAIHRPLHDSLVAVDPHAVLAAAPRPVLVVDISMAARPGRATQRLARDLHASGSNVAVRVVAGQEAWWFSTSGGRQRPADPTQDMVDVTAEFVGDLLGGRG